MTGTTYHKKGKDFDITKKRKRNNNKGCRQLKSSRLIKIIDNPHSTATARDNAIRALHELAEQDRQDRQDRQSDRIPTYKERIRTYK